jgi:hypothetical protein
MRGRSFVLAAVLLALYALFWFWYGGSTRPLETEEIEACFRKIAEQQAARGPASALTRERLRRFAETDDGREFYMLNLLRLRAEPQYPDGRPAGEPTERVLAAYVRAWARAAIPRASHPVWMGRPVLKLFGEPEEALWEQAAIVRYRSRRDLLEMIATSAFSQDASLKDVAVEATDVWPATNEFLIVSPRLVVLLLLVLLGGFVHLFLARRQRTRPGEGRP